MDKNKDLKRATKSGKRSEKGVLKNVNKIINETKSYIDVWSKLTDKNADPDQFLKANKKLE